MKDLLRVTVLATKIGLGLVPEVLDPVDAFESKIGMSPHQIHVR